MVKLGNIHNKKVRCFICGQFGWILVPNLKRESDIAVMAALLSSKNDKRGGQSWGFLADGEIVKGLGDAELMGKANLDKLASSRVALLHTRLATHGEKTIENSHPFQFDNIIGSHNGVLYNHTELNKIHSREFEVDSMHILKHIQEGRTTFADIEGYGATQHIDLNKPGKVYLTKFNSGQMSVIKIPKIGVFWSSLYEDLKRALVMGGFIDGEDSYQLMKFEDEDIIECTIDRRGEANCYSAGKIDITKRVTTLTWQNYSQSVSSWRATVETKKESAGESAYLELQYGQRDDPEGWNSPKANGAKTDYCEVCDGTGRTLNNSKCGVCDGSGVQPIDLCLICDGTGKEGHESCFGCYGTGKDVVVVNGDDADYDTGHYDTNDDIDPSSLGSGFDGLSKEEIEFLILELQMPEEFVYDLSLEEAEELRREYDGKMGEAYYSFDRIEGHENFDFEPDDGDVEGRREYMEFLKEAQATSAVSLIGSSR